MDRRRDQERHNRCLIIAAGHLVGTEMLAFAVVDEEMPSALLLVAWRAKALVVDRSGSLMRMAVGRTYGAGSSSSSLADTYADAVAAFGRHLEVR